MTLIHLEKKKRLKTNKQTEYPGKGDLLNKLLNSESGSDILFPVLLET